MSEQDKLLTAAFLAAVGAASMAAAATKAHESVKVVQVNEEPGVVKIVLPADPMADMIDEDLLGQLMTSSGPPLTCVRPTCG